MTAPNMDGLTASLERSLGKISLNHHHDNSSSSSSISSGGYAGGGGGSKSSADNLDLMNDSVLDLHSETPLPHFWEQCLDLKTGELYYINWRTGMKYREDPRRYPEIIADSYSEEDSRSYDSEGSSSESYQTMEVSMEERRQYENNIGSEIKPKKSGGGDSGVLVVAGCKSCLMYFMVPKQENECPTCYGQLLHFDPTQNGSTAA